MPQSPYATVAYLVNQYPKVSHSFIRREIAGLETHGIRVGRFSIRYGGANLADGADVAELQKTRTVLGVGIAGLLRGVLRTVTARPAQFLKALRLALKTGWRSDRGVALHLAYLAEACVLLRWLSDAGADHLHAHFGTNSAAVAMLVTELGGPPYSFTVHGPEEFDRPQLLALREKVERASFAVTVSEFGRSQLYRWCNYKDWSKIHIIHCGADEQFLAAPHTPVPVEPRLVSVGRLDVQKGYPILLEAASRLAAQGLPFQLVLVGDGPMRAELEAQIARLGLQKRVEILGWASGERVRQEILAARAMVLPSLAEGLPVVLMEALALGRPAISTCVAGIPELIEPGVSGWLVPAGSVEALADAMSAACCEPVEKLEQMGKRGAERVAKQHNAAVEAGKLAALFRASIDRARLESLETGFLEKTRFRAPTELRNPVS
ncbi:glycosyltransferase family 4 protein [Kamptonema formosum]|uniref:glycosyltransferase family 4 protein n=1 Tax=Kamptonema formosum TaxID=331992 RepID=UPI00034AC0A9|nr:glycosyltransferase family 4 protein [Oscillatoria sp. PCC 10802]